MELMPLKEEIDQQFDAVERHYRPVPIGTARLHGRQRLMGQFEDVVRNYRSSALR
jgi:hypothetical protein